MDHLPEGTACSVLLLPDWVNTDGKYNSCCDVMCAKAVCSLTSPTREVHVNHAQENACRQLAGQDVEICDRVCLFLRPQDSILDTANICSINVA